MTPNRFVATLRRARGDRGYALLAVTGLGLVMLLFVATSLTVASSGYKKARNDEDFNAALSAAYGGMAEYQSRLSADSTYVKYGNRLAPYSTTSTDTGTTSGTSLLTLPSGSNVNPAFGIGTAGTWANIPGGGGSKFRYEVNTKDYAATGVVHLRVTGRTNTQTRSIIADLKQNGFIDFVYFSDYEVSDPQITGADAATCIRYAWATPARVSDSRCQSIQFGAFDTINGPLHSNDRLSICGATFKGAVTTASTSTPIFSTPGGCGSPTFAVGTGPTYHSSISMPPTNAELKAETRYDLPSVAVPGCLYTGPTQITFNPNGTMTVVSPWTQKTQTSGNNQGQKPDLCGKPGDGGGELGSVLGATIPTLPSNLIYVQSLPSDPADPNYEQLTKPPKDFTCTNANGISGWTLSKGGTTIQYPLLGETAPLGSSSTNPAYNCTNGDLYVKGTLKGAMTVAAENNVYVIGDITLVDKTKDILGIVATNAVYVWNPNVAVGATSGDRTIQASILSVAHTFQVQNYSNGSVKGTLNVFGAIAQKYRGTVATSSGGIRNSGYAKNYVYDPRLRYTAPPKFLTPTSTTYGVSQVAAVPAAFSATGAVIP